MVLFFFIFIISLSILLYASDKLVESAENIGLAFGIPSFVIGVTIVAFGTSLPELATSIASVYSGSSEIVLGNVLGSNITNIFLIIGFTAVIGRGIKIDFDVMNVDIPMLLGSVVLFYFAIADGNFSIIEAVIFLIALGIFLAHSFNPDEKEDDTIERTMVHIKDWGKLIVSAIAVFVGAKYTIYGMENMATALNIPNHVIAISAVALGTSLPELIVSAAAARRGQHGIAVGNVLGSNIFNTYIVMGLARLFGPLTIPENTMVFSFPMMAAATLLFAFACKSKRITRWEGWLFLLMYVFFLYQLFS